MHGTLSSPTVTQEQLKVIRERLVQIHSKVVHMDVEFELWNVVYKEVRERIGAAPGIAERHTYMKNVYRKTRSECSICYNTHTHYQTVTTNCGHMFGYRCFFGWIESGVSDYNSCPMCRTQVHTVSTPWPKR